MPETSTPAPTRHFRAYAAANAGIAMLRQIIAFMPLYFYSPPQGMEYLSAKAVGVALVIARLFDIVSDPLVGYLSDRTRHRWGRRVPYIVWGSIPWLIVTVLIFLPPGGGPGPLNFVYLTVMATLFFFGMTAVQIPYMAVLPEIAWEEDQAMRVAGSMGKFYLLGALLVLSAGWFLAGRIGYPTAVAVFALLAGLTFTIAIRKLLTVEHRPVARDADGFWRSAIEIVRQRPFWTYLVGHSLFIAGYYTVLVASPYFATQIARLPAEMTGLVFLLPMVVAILLAPLVERLCLRFGKKPVMMAAMLVFSIVTGLWYFVGRGPAPTPGAGPSPGLLAQVLLLFGAIGFSASAQMLVPNAIVADLVVHDEHRTGRRRESLVYGLQGGVEKNAVMLATLAVSLALSGGKDAQDPAGIYRVGPIASLMTLIGCAVFGLYPLKKGWQQGPIASPPATQGGPPNRPRKCRTISRSDSPAGA